MLCELRGIPLPPSENCMYKNVLGKGRTKNAIYRAFEKECEAWQWTHLVQLGQARAAIKSNQELMLLIDFRFLTGRVYTKAGTPQIMDVLNRPKALVDIICKMLEIDDSRIFGAYCQKGPSKIEECILRFYAFNPLPFD